MSVCNDPPFCCTIGLLFPSTHSSCTNPGTGTLKTSLHHLRLLYVLSQTPRPIPIHPFNFSSINLSQNFVSKCPPKLLSCGLTQLSSLLSLGVPCLSSSLVVYDSPEFSFLGPPCATPVPYRHSCSRTASSLTSISFLVLGLHRAWYLTGSLCVFSLLSTLAHLL